MSELAKRLRSIEWCYYDDATETLVPDDTPSKAADALEANIKWQQRMVAIMAAGGKLDAYREMAKRLADTEAEMERLLGYVYQIEQCLIEGVEGSIILGIVKKAGVKRLHHIGNVNEMVGDRDD